jgi:hypothetical protein
MPRDPTHTSSSPRFDPEEALWAEIIRYEVDSWNPRWLPPRFQPHSSRRGGRWWGSLPQVVAVCVLVLVVAALSGFNSNVAGVRDNLTGIHPAANHAGRGHGGAPAFRDTHRPSRSSGPASSTRTGSNPAATSSPPTSQLGTASGPRTISPAPSAEPPMPTSSPPDLPAPPSRIPRLPQLSPPPFRGAQPVRLSPDARAGSAGRPGRSPGQ